ncbi:hypothetical protein [Chthonobacter albigriseus]|uniref:hypothetical protein n=1 Tax=Chthonobacter albigriseus TaxID=1683161 RepID=UPI0015EE6EFE|nr:hypothetical protein [Chthonobacter albigriseus]
MLKELAYRFLSDKLRGGRGYGSSYDKKMWKKRAKYDAYRRDWGDRGYGPGPYRDGYGSGYGGYQDGYRPRSKGLKGMLMEALFRYFSRRR